MPLLLHNYSCLELCLQLVEIQIQLQVQVKIQLEAKIHCLIHARRNTNTNSGEDTIASKDTIEYPNPSLTSPPAPYLFMPIALSQKCANIKTYSKEIHRNTTVTR